MSYNPNFPSDTEELVGEPFRNQYNALKAMYDAQALLIAALQAQVAALQTQVATLQTALAAKPSMDQVNEAIVADSAGNVDNVEAPSGNPSDPDVLQLYYFANNLLTAAKRPS